jgi:hypothetical protein
MVESNNSMADTAVGMLPPRLILNQGKNSVAVAIHSVVGNGISGAERPASTQRLAITEPSENTVKGAFDSGTPHVIRGAGIAEPGPPTPTNNTPPKIRYKLEWSIGRGKSGVFEQADVPFDIQISSDLETQTNIENKPVPILEVITAVDCRRIRPKNNQLVASLQQVETEEFFEETTLKNLEILSLKAKRLVIYSQWLLEAIREVADYYPRYVIIAGLRLLRWFTNMRKVKISLATK